MRTSLRVGRLDAQQRIAGHDISIFFRAGAGRTRPPGVFLGTAPSFTLGLVIRHRMLRVIRGTALRPVLEQRPPKTFSRA
jgi:hypothetical protein